VLNAIGRSGIDIKTISKINEVCKRPLVDG
jgi:hypothetical protein